MKYKEDDKVKIREDLVVGRVYGADDFSDEMTEYKGKVATIDYVCKDGYYLNIDNGYWHWTDEMLEDYTEDTKKESETHSAVRTVDVGFHFDYCGNKVLKDVLQGETGKIRHYYTKDYEIQYIIPIENVDFIVPHED